MAQAEMITCTYCSARAFGLELRLCSHCGNGYCEVCHSNDDYCPACVQLTCHDCKTEDIDRGEHHVCGDCNNNFCSKCFFSFRCNRCAKAIIREDIEGFGNWELGNKDTQFDIGEFINWLYRTYDLKFIYDGTENRRSIKKLYKEYIERPKNPELSNAKIGKINWVIN